MKGLRALVVEDEHFIADDLRAILERGGAAAVMSSGTIDDARKQVRDDGSEFALLDLNLQGEMAFSLGDEFHSRRVPFAFVSGYERSLIPPRFAAVPNWSRPYDVGEIVDGILRLCARPAAAEASKAVARPVQTHPDRGAA